MKKDKSKYLEAFKAIKESQSAHYNLVGDVLIVEKVAGGELKKEVIGPGGKKTEIYLAGGNEKKIDGLDMNLPMFVRILDVGPGFYDPKDEDLISIGCEVEVGDIILVGRMSVNWFSVFGNLVSTAQGEIGLARESDVRMRFRGQEGYDSYFHLLNQNLSPTNAESEKAL